MEDEEKLPVVAIIGRQNVGKSSLLNALARQGSIMLHWLEMGEMSAPPVVVVCVIRFVQPRQRFSSFPPGVLCGYKEIR